VEAPDHLEAEDIAGTLRSPGYILIAKRIDAEIGKRVKGLIEADHDAAGVAKLRGEILALRLALEIPKFIAAEARNAQPKTRKNASQR